jgi:hypothetical protein
MNNGMKPLQRYEMVTFENWSRDNEHLDSYTEHQPSDNGDWVRYEDVRELEKQNKEMLKALKKLLPIVIEYESSYDEYVYLDTIFFAESVISSAEGRQE